MIANIGIKHKQGWNEMWLIILFIIIIAFIALVVVFKQVAVHSGYRTIELPQLIYFKSTLNRFLSKVPNVNKSGLKDLIKIERYDPLEIFICLYTEMSNSKDELMPLLEDFSELVVKGILYSLNVYHFDFTHSYAPNISCEIISKTGGRLGYSFYDKRVNKISYMTEDIINFAAQIVNEK